MKKKKILLIFPVVVLIVIIYSFILIKNFTTTSYGKLDTLFGVMSKIEEHFNPISLKGKSIYEMRAALHKSTTIWKSKPIPFSNIKNMDIKTASNQVPVRIYTPDVNGNKLPIIIYSHGGSWISGSIDDYDNVCRKLSKNSKAIVVSVNYRLAPEDPFPAGVNDIYNVLQWVYKYAKSINGDSSRICIVGDSAGANLSAVVSQMARDKGGPHIISQVLIYPSTNIYQLNTKSWSYFGMDYNLTRENSEKFISLYTPSLEERKSGYASPLLSKNFKDLPDTLIITAEFDPLRDEGEAYGNKLKQAGVDVISTRYKGVTHGFISMDKITNKADDALIEISTYLKEKFNRKQI
ncbi:alpha/beta hydrolase [Clostridium estertheticum]|uniref:alpha/beta hydrolase n=1 Tax=Clostridium estertheticum TaxID=238834 RepID=UPI001C0AE1FE|nr:alpha/beta hydrolase [Clostridium estertheticum]MBU3215599.1 alpha/beta hydrolase [Clostridium estertheticum]WAG56783.1 alpha/beta hydrolase [Clostridium estertheticum]